VYDFTVIHQVNAEQLNSHSLNKSRCSLKIIGGHPVFFLSLQIIFSYKTTTFMNKVLLFLTMLVGTLTAQASLTPTPLQGERGVNCKAKEH
jgi:hypothetical protein